MAKQKIRMGLIGCGGNMQRAHLPRLLADGGVDVVGVADPDESQAQALFEEGMALRDTGDNEGAIDLLTQAIDLNPDLGLAHYWRAAIYQNVGQIENAIAGYQTALELAPEQIQIHIDISDMYA